MAKFDIYQAITNNIIESIEAGAGEFTMPWQRGINGALPLNVSSGKNYQGINTVNLWVTAMAKGYSSSTWGTYKQWAEKDAQVRKGEKSSLVVFYKQIKFKDKQTGEEIERPMIRASYGFNADQVDGYEEKPVEELEPIERIAAVDQFVKDTGATVKTGGNQAFYVPSKDYIQMPKSELFTGTKTSSREESYYSTLLHELTHWSGAEKRLNRTMGKRFGDNAYAMEELVAELGAAFQCSQLNISLEPRADHAKYLANWLQVLKDDNKAIFAASSAAQKAVTYIAKAAEDNRKATPKAA